MAIIQTGNQAKATHKPRLPNPTINAGTNGSLFQADAINNVGKRKMESIIMLAKILAENISIVSIVLSLEGKF